jgi:hypothetical protein
MKPIYQTRDGKDGDCLRACIASLFEVDLEQIPDFGAAVGQWLRLESFMNERNMRPLGFSPMNFTPPYNAYYLIWGVGPRGARHSCIGLNGEIVHDPHPSSAGLQIIDQYVIFVSFVSEE